MKFSRATDQRYVALDDAQYASGQGPCLEALDAVAPVAVADASVDDRWTHFSHTAAHLGIHSTLSIHLPVDAAEVAASLNLYSRRRMQLGDAQVRAALPYAEQLAAAILSVDAYRSAARLARDMVEAMRSRAVIEQAKGILMADQRISAEEAFQQLTKLSQRTNTKLRDVALRLVSERTEGGRST